jgi:hypothetical protein
MFFKNRDIFYYPIQLNFKSGQNTTYLGGFTSIFVKLALFAYLALLLSQMIQFANADVSTRTRIAPESSHNQTVFMNKTGINPIIIIKNVKTNEFIEYDDAMKKYISVEMGQRSQMYNLKDNKVDQAVV